MQQLVSLITNHQPTNLSSTPLPARSTLQIYAYNFDKPGPNPSTSQFTQLVWSNTTRIGCAASTTCSWSIVLCYYEPAGNDVLSDWSAQVKPASLASPPAGAAASGGSNDGQPLITMQAVSKPVPPPDFPRAFSALTDDPLPSRGLPFTPEAQRGPTSAAVLSPALQEGLERTNALRCVQRSLWAAGWSMCMKRRSLNAIAPTQGASSGGSAHLG